MGHRPTPGRPAVEPEIIPPDRAEARLASSGLRIWISFNKRGDGRTHVMSSNAFTIVLALLLGILTAATFTIVFATILIWVVVAGVLLALLFLTVLLLRRFRVHRKAR